MKLMVFLSKACTFYLKLVNIFKFLLIIVYGHFSEILVLLMSVQLKHQHQLKKKYSIQCCESKAHVGATLKNTAVSHTLFITEYS